MSKIKEIDDGIKTMSMDQIKKNYKGFNRDEFLGYLYIDIHHEYRKVIKIKKK